MKGLRQTAVLEKLKGLASRHAKSRGDCNPRLQSPADHGCGAVGVVGAVALGPPPVVEALEGRQLLSAALTGTFATLPPSLPAGAPDAVALRVSNTGDARASGPATVQLYASTDATLDSADTLLTTQTRRLNLKPGSSASVPLPFNVPASLTGDYFLLAKIDAPQAGVPSATVASPAALPVQAAFVDLAGRISKLPARPVEFGRRPRLSQMTVEVVNQGNVVVRGRLSVTVYLSISGRLDTTAVPLNVSLPRNVKLRPGEKARLKVPFRAPDGTAPGLYYLLAQVNAPGIAERDTGNNLAASATQVEVIPAPRRSRLGFGWEIGGVFYPCDADYPYFGYPTLGFYSAEAYGIYGANGTPPDYVTPPPDTGTPPYEEPLQTPQTPPPTGGPVDTSSSSNGADFGTGSNSNSSDTGSGNSGAPDPGSSPSPPDPSPPDTGSSSGSSGSSDSSSSSSSTDSGSSSDSSSSGSSDEEF